MTINNKDDYEKLAKILYPSIEASGNVYYGQTRKLTMDEILGKNELNFESHIETFNNGDFTYSSYFMWKLGPFYGSIKFDANKGDNLSSIKWESFPDTDRFEIINPYENEQNYFLYNVEMYDYGQEDQEIPHIYTHNINLYGTVFAKYDIIIDESITSHEILNSGEYNTYSNDAHCEFCNLCLTSGYNPTDHDDYILGDRNFFVESKNGHNYLYIQICSNTILDEFYELPIGEPFKITSRNSTAEFYISTPTGNPDPNYVYSFDGLNWHTLGIGYENKVDIPADSSIYIKGRCNTIDSSNYIQFSNLNEYSKLYASGDIKWLNYNLNDDTYTMRPYAFYKLFSSLGMNRTLVSAPNLSYFSLANNCYANLFQSCNLLESMPILPAKTLAENCYAYMFQSCSKIKKASTLPAKNIPNNAYTAIFSSISSLNNITCLAISKQQSSFTFWLDSVAQQGILNVSKTDIFPENTSSGKPNGWEFNVVNNIGSGLYIRNASVYTNSVYHKTKNPYFVLSGSDSKINGRGLLNSSTLFNMLDTNPLYNSGVAFDTYNKDGSFNQEIWGYKCFNSPVMFRNGLYGECASLTTSQMTDLTGLLTISDVCSSSLISNKPIEYFPNNESFVTVASYTIDAPQTVYNSQASICSNWPIEGRQLGYINDSDSNLQPYSAGVYTYASGADIMGNYEKSFGTVIACKEAEAFASIRSYVDTDAHHSTVSITADSINLLSNRVEINHDLYVDNIYRITPIKRSFSLDIPLNNTVLLCLKFANIANHGTHLQKNAMAHIDKPFTIFANDSSTVSIYCNTGRSFNYRLNDIGEWVAYTSETPITLNKGDTISFICTEYTSSSSTAHGHTSFSISGNVSIIGNLCSLITDNFNQQYGINLVSYGDYVFYELFINCNGIYDASAAYINTSGAYTESCFQKMFMNCINLKHAINIRTFGSGPSMAPYSYADMYSGCSSLKDHPPISAQSMSSSSCRCMFYNCTSLEYPPIIDCDNTATYCYEDMFRGCVNLKYAPILYATNLALNCYKGMFLGCSSLKYILCYAQTSDNNSDMQWLNTTTGLSSKLLLTSQASADVTSALCNLPNDWTYSTDLDSPLFKISNYINYGTEFKLGYYFGTDGLTIDMLGTDRFIKQIRDINIAQLNINNGAVTYAVGSDSVCYDYKFVAISSSYSSTDTDAMYVLALRIE